MKIILIGNYKKDKQESMDRFAKALCAGYNKSGVLSEIWLPDVLLATWAKSTNAGLGKWLGYIDKLIFFPIKLKIRLLKAEYKSSEIRFHICDHSNSFYLNFLPANRTIITCHDVLAIRGALGHKDAYCPATKTGVLFQKWILKNLSLAKRLVAVSKFTLGQLINLLPNTVIANQKWAVIHNGFNENFWKMKIEQASVLLNNVGILNNEIFILHVGSGLARKNRKMLLDIVYSLGDKYIGKICFAGQPIDNDLMAHAISLNVESRVISVCNPNHITLVALYSHCAAFVFPSFSEGFGWPLIEAQACGAPVITSRLEPFQEVAGTGALYADPNDPAEFSMSFQKLLNPDFKSNLIQQGLNNCLRFNSEHMINNYIKMSYS